MKGIVKMRWKVLMSLVLLVLSSSALAGKTVCKEGSMRSLPRVTQIEILRPIHYKRDTKSKTIDVSKKVSCTLTLRNAHPYSKRVIAKDYAAIVLGARNDWSFDSERFPQKPYLHSVTLGLVDKHRLLFTLECMRNSGAAREDDYITIGELPRELSDYVKFDLDIVSCDTADSEQVYIQLFPEQQGGAGALVK